MIAFLGWNPGGTEEILSMDEMIEKFSFEKVGKSGAKFDLKKADWFNHQHMKNADNYKLAEMWKRNLVKSLLEDNDTTEFNLPGIFDTKFGTDYIPKVCELLKEKVSNINDFYKSGKYFFVAPTPTLGSEHSAFLAEVIANVTKDEVFNHDSLRAVFDASVKATGVDAREAGMILRIAVTGMKVGPPLFDAMALIGKNESLNRIASNVAVNHE
jgi:glutamyl-tRNA synthetase